MEFKNIDVIEESPLSIELLFKYCGLHERLPKSNVFGEIISGDYIFQYCMRGKGKFIVDGVSHPLKKGEGIFTFPGQKRTEIADEEDPWGMMWIGIGGKSAQDFVSKLNITAENPVIRNLESTEIPVLLKKIIDVAESIGFQRDFLLAKRMFDFFDKLTEMSEYVNELPRSMADNYVAQATYYIDLHFSDKNITVQSLADSIGLNRSYFYEIFKQRTGLSPQEYLTKLRISKALSFMALPQATVTSVANSVGYEPSVFSKAFKKTVGITPKEYLDLKEKT